MHELSVVASLTETILEHLPEGARLVAATVEVGDLEHLDDEAVQVAWRACTGSPPLAGATLEIRRIAVRVRCQACGVEHHPAEPAYLVCPRCGEASPDVLEGWGVTLRALDAETDVTPRCASARPFN